MEEGMGFLSILPASVTDHWETGAHHEPTPGVVAREEERAPHASVLQMHVACGQGPPGRLCQRPT